MALTLLQQYQLSTDTGFRQRVAAAMSKAAVAILSEALETEWYESRSRLAQSVQRDEDAAVTEFARAVAGQLPDQPDSGEAGDTAIYGAVSGVWTQIARLPA